MTFRYLPGNCIMHNTFTLLIAAPVRVIINIIIINRSYDSVGGCNCGDGPWSERVRPKRTIQ